MVESRILLIGMNHNTAPVEIRERLAARCSDPSIYADVRPLCLHLNVSEYLILSTCNRIEFLLVSANSEGSGGIVQQINALVESTVRKSNVDGLMYRFLGRDAVAHVFKVASGLDSMVLGEPQILGQLKDAYRCAAQQKTTGVILNRLLHKAFSVAKRIRSETGIGCHAVSVSYAAVELAKRIFGDLKDKAVLLIGAGDMAELAAEHLLGSGVTGIFIANRTLERAIELARRFHAETVPFDRFVDSLEYVDIVIASTGATDFILRKSEVKGIMRRRKNRPLFIIDIAVPRNIEPSVNDLDNVFVYDIDDLQGVVEKNKNERVKEAQRALHIVDEETFKFIEWLQTLDVVPAIIALRHKAEEIRRKELEKTFAKLQHLDNEERRAIYVLTEAIVKKMLHDPIIFLKNKASRPSKEFYVDLVQQIFNLPIGERHPMRSLDRPEPECYEAEGSYVNNQIRRPIDGGDN